MTSPTRNIRVALLGCGQIADAHLQPIRKIEWAEPVAVCDVHQHFADQPAATTTLVGHGDGDREAWAALEWIDAPGTVTPARQEACS